MHHMRHLSPLFILLLVVMSLSCKKEHHDREDVTFSFTVSISDGVLSEDELASPPVLTLSLSSDAEDEVFSGSILIDGAQNVAIGDLRPDSQVRVPLGVVGATYGKHEASVTVRHERTGMSETKDAAFYVREAAEPEISFHYINGLGEETDAGDGSELTIYTGEPGSLLIRTEPACSRLNVTCSSSLQSVLSVKTLKSQDGLYPLSLTAKKEGRSDVIITVEELDRTYDVVIPFRVEPVPETTARLRIEDTGAWCTDGTQLDRLKGAVLVSVVPDPEDIYWSSPSILSFTRNVLDAQEASDGLFRLLPGERGEARIYAFLERNIEWRNAYLLKVIDRIAVELHVSTGGVITLSFQEGLPDEYTVTGKAVCHGYLSYTVARQNGTIPKTQAEADALNERHEDMTAPYNVTLSSKTFNPASENPSAWTSELASTCQSISAIHPNVTSTRWENHGSSQGYQIYDNTSSIKYIPVLDRLELTIAASGPNPELCYYSLTTDASGVVTVRTGK